MQDSLLTSIEFNFGDTQSKSYTNVFLYAVGWRLRIILSLLQKCQHKKTTLTDRQVLIYGTWWSAERICNMKCPYGSNTKITRRKQQWIKTVSWIFPGMERKHLRPKIRTERIKARLTPTVWNGEISRNSSWSGAEKWNSNFSWSGTEK